MFAEIGIVVTTRPFRDVVGNRQSCCTQLFTKKRYVRSSSKKVSDFVEPAGNIRRSLPHLQVLKLKTCFFTLAAQRSLPRYLPFAPPGPRSLRHIRKDMLAASEVEQAGTSDDKCTYRSDTDKCPRHWARAEQG